jgi:hypothetical protein
MTGTVRFGTVMVWAIENPMDEIAAQSSAAR